MEAIKLSELSLFPATQEQTIVSRKRTYLQWGKGLTEEQYLHRDAVLDMAEHATNGKLITWVLAPRNDSKTLEFKCACETYRRTGMVVRAGTEAGEEMQCYGIATVFTPPKNRGKGYARHMMRLLHWVLAPGMLTVDQFPAAWGAPPREVEGAGEGLFSVLYSDAGEHFYLNCGPDEATGGGWLVRGANATIWDVNNGRVREATGSHSLEHRWKMLDDREVEELWKKDAAQMRRQLGEEAKKLSTGKVLFTFLPDRGMGAFLNLRTTFFAHTNQRLDKWGTILVSKSDSLGEGDQDLTTFATWSIDVGPPESTQTLIVTRLVATEETFLVLAKLITKVASDAGLERVEVWNLPAKLAQLTVELLGGTTGDRDEHLSAFKWYGGESNENIDWRYNEKYVLLVSEPLLLE